MLDEQVKGVMRNALKTTSKRTKVGLRTLRVKMELTDDMKGARCIALDKTEVVGEVKWDTILGIKYGMFKRSIVGQIVNRLHEIAEMNGLDKTKVNARVYALDANATAGVYLYDGGKRLKQIDINDLI